MLHVVRERERGRERLGADIVEARSRHRSFTRLMVPGDVNDADVQGGGDVGQVVARHDALP